MKDKTIAISMYIALGLVAAGLFIVAAVEAIHWVQDVIIVNSKTLENY